MERPLLLVALLALAAVLVAQGYRLRREGRARRARRAAVLDAVLPLLRSPRGRIEPDGFARLAGTYGGALVDLRVVADTLTTRKLPALWCLATLTEAQPLPATWHLMLRPRGTETFSAFDSLPRTLPVPPGLPHDAGLRTNGGEPPPAVLAAMEAAVASLGEARLKEVVLSPRGLRLTWLAEEAHRGRYLLFRDAEMDAPVLHDDLAALLDALLVMRGLLARPEKLSA